jgi:hypothetical protein
MRWVEHAEGMQGHDARKNSVALVGERTIPTELPLLVNEGSANFCA